MGHPVCPFPLKKLQQTQQSINVMVSKILNIRADHSGFLQIILIHRLSIAKKRRNNSIKAKKQNETANISEIK